MMMHQARGNYYVERIIMKIFFIFQVIIFHSEESALFWRQRYVDNFFIRVGEFSTERIGHQHKQYSTSVTNIDAIHRIQLILSLCGGFYTVVIWKLTVSSNFSSMKASI